MRLLLLFTFLLLNSVKPVWGQSKGRAQRFLNLAQNFKAQKDTAKAYEYVTLAIDESPGFSDAYAALGLWLYDSKNYIWAARTYVTAAQKCSNGKALFGLAAARNYLLAQEPDSALYWLGQSNSKNAEATKIRNQASAAAGLLNATDTNHVHKLDLRINTKFPEFFPSLSADGQTLYFTRRINGVNEDFFEAHPDSCGGWFTAKNMGYPPNTASQESAQTISSDDHYLFFTRGDNRSENGWGRGGYDLYMSYRISPDSAWKAAESFGATINTPAFEGMPSFSPDLRDLYFVSDRPGGLGGLDIWVSHFAFGLWQMPVNLGPTINTPGNETSPFISSDNKTLYFASDGLPGLGSSDLFVSRKEGKETWSAATNLGVPINSAADDNSIFVCPDGHNAYFASDRENTNGNLDIYQTTIPQALAPVSTAFTLCYIYDSLTKEPALIGSITLYDSVGTELAMYHANKGDGSLLMSLPLNTKFNFEVKGFNYTAVEGGISFPEACPKWCVLNFALLPRDYVKPTYDSLLMTVNFAKNVTTLNDTQVAAIQKVLGNWVGRKEISVFVNSYTDNTGTPMINTEKSTIRANAVTDIISKMGFDYSIITTTGFGDANPIAPNDSPENQDKNRRAEIVMRWSE